MVDSCEGNARAVSSFAENSVSTDGHLESKLLVEIYKFTEDFRDMAVGSKGSKKTRIVILTENQL